MAALRLSVFSLGQISEKAFVINCEKAKYLIEYVVHITCLLYSNESKTFANTKARHNYCNELFGNAAQCMNNVK